MFDDLLFCLFVDVFIVTTRETLTAKKAAISTGLLAKCSHARAPKIKTKSTLN